MLNTQHSNSKDLKNWAKIPIYIKKYLDQLPLVSMAISK